MSNSLNKFFLIIMQKMNLHYILFMILEILILFVTGYRIKLHMYLMLLYFLILFLLHVFLTCVFPIMTLLIRPCFILLIILFLILLPVKIPPVIITIIFIVLQFLVDNLSDLRLDMYGGMIIIFLLLNLQLYLVKFLNETFFIQILKLFILITLQQQMWNLIFIIKLLETLSGFKLCSLSYRL